MSKSSCKFFTDEDGVVHPIRSTCEPKKKKKKSGLPGSEPGDQITRRKRIRRSPSPPRPDFSSPARTPPPSPVRKPAALTSSYYPGFKSRAELGANGALEKLRSNAMAGKGVGRLKKTQELLVEANKLMERDYKGKKTFLKRSKKIRV